MIRSKWKSKVPIVVAHCDELSKESLKKLGAIYQVFVMNICNSKQPALKLKKVRGFFCKPVALWKSPFQDSLMFDLDVIWFKSPELLFNSRLFNSSGNVNACFENHFIGF